MDKQGFIVKVVPYAIGLCLFQASIAIAIGPFHANLYQLLSLVSALVFCFHKKILGLIVAGLAIIIFQLIVVYFIESSIFLKDGYFGRIVSYFVYIVPTVVLSMLLYVNYFSAYAFIRGVFHSAFIMIALGILQWIVYSTLGVDLFPYDIFYGGEGRSAYIVLEGVNQNLRLTALSGEPKTYGMFLALLFSLFLFWNFDLKKRTVYVLLVSCLLLIVGTASTSAFVCVAIALVFYFIVPSKKTAVIWAIVSVAVFYLIFFLMIFGFLEYSVSEVDYNNLGKGFLYDRLINRINGVEDYDFLSLNVLKSNPLFLLYGGVFPFFHLVNLDFGSLPWWMNENTIFVPKAGFLTIVSIFGLPLSFILGYFYLSFLYKKSVYFTEREFIFLCLVLPLMFFLRAYLLIPSILLVFSLISIRANNWKRIS